MNNGQSWEALRKEFKQRDIYREVNYRELFRPEVTDTLRQLKAAGFRLALASSTHLKLVERVLEENQIREYFEAVVSGEQFKQSKPNPEIYYYTAKALNIFPEECLAVEDSSVGILAAYQAGMKVAAVADERYCFDQSLAHFRLLRVKDVLEVLKKA